jgi:hypothetical protein
MQHHEIDRQWANNMPSMHAAATCYPSSKPTSAKLQPIITHSEARALKLMIKEVPIDLDRLFSTGTLSL